VKKVDPPVNSVVVEPPKEQQPASDLLVDKIPTKGDSTGSTIPVVETPPAKPREDPAAAARAREAAAAKKKADALKALDVQ
jgi:hypothetical protein